MAPAGIAVFGAGLIGRRHIDLILAEPLVKLVGIVEPNTDLAAELSAKGLPVFSDIETLAATGSVEGAVIATPNATHFPVAEACAAQGWAVLVEKPIAEDAAAATRMIEACRAANVPLLVGHHRRYHPCVETARNLIADGGLGRLVAVSSHWAARKPDGYFAQAWRLGAGGGPVMINLIHDIDLMRTLCGEITSISAETSSAIRGNELEDTAAVTLRFANGALGTMILSDAALSPWTWEGASGENPDIFETGQASHRFMGTAGSLEFPSMRLWQPADAETADPEVADWSQPLRDEIVNTQKATPLVAQLRHFIDVMQGRAEPLVSGEDARASLIATLAVHQAATSGERVEIT